MHMHLQKIVVRHSLKTQQKAANKENFAIIAKSLVLEDESSGIHRQYVPTNLCVAFVKRMFN